METGGRSMDRISVLPENIIEHILTLMPIRDAVRTSILSKDWRYTWRSMPKLVFTDNMVKVPTIYALLEKSLLVNAIFHVLLLHNGPTILEFNHSFHRIQMDSELDQIISYLSKGNNVKQLFLVIQKGFYQLPASFFSLQGLEILELNNCVFIPPLTFNEYSWLKELIFWNVKVSAQVLQRFLSKCPLLEHISLFGDEEGIDFAAGGTKFTFVDLVQCVPLINCLEISKEYMKSLCAGAMPHKLPTLLDHLEYLFLDVCLMEQNEISSVLCMIRSSPELVKLIIMLYDDDKLPVRQTPTNFLDPEGHSDLSLECLNTLEIQMFSNLPLEMEFVKLVMAKSPMLEMVQIKLDDNVSADEELKMLKNLVLLPFLRASPSAKLIIERP